MSEGITSRDMYRRAVAVVADLEKRVKAGTATDRERHRYRAGLDEILVWEWAQDNAPAVGLIPSAPINPTIARFLLWYDRNKHRPEVVIGGWRAALWQWLGEPADIDLEVWNAADDVFGDAPDMVLNDLGAWNRMMSDEDHEAAA